MAAATSVAPASPIVTVLLQTTDVEGADGGAKALSSALPRAKL